MEGEQSKPLETDLKVAESKQVRGHGFGGVKSVFPSDPRLSYSLGASVVARVLERSVFGGTT